MGRRLEPAYGLGLGVPPARPRQPFRHREPAIEPVEDFPESGLFVAGQRPRIAESGRGVEQPLFHLGGGISVVAYESHERGAPHDLAASLSAQPGSGRRQDTFETGGLYNSRTPLQALSRRRMPASPNARVFRFSLRGTQGPASVGARRAVPSSQPSQISSHSLVLAVL